MQIILLQDEYDDLKRQRSICEEYRKALENSVEFEYDNELINFLCRKDHIKKIKINIYHLLPATILEQLKEKDIGIEVVNHG